MIKMLIGAIWGVIFVLSIIGIKSENEYKMGFSIMGIVVCVICFIVWLASLPSVLWNL